MRELIERKCGSWDTSLTSISSSTKELTQYATWLLHYLLVYSFTRKDLADAGLFATILTDNQLYGTVFSKIVHIRSSSLTRYMIASFLIA